MINKILFFVIFSLFLSCYNNTKNLNTKSIQDYPDNFITNPKITIYKPFVDETISSGKPFNIEWESISLSKEGINLYYSIDDGMNWEEIGEYFPNNGVSESLGDVSEATWSSANR